MSRIRPALQRFPHSFHDITKTPNIGIVSAPFNKGQPKLGVELGPKIIKQQGLMQNLKSLGYKKITEYPELQFEIIENEEPDGNVNFPVSSGKANEEIYKGVYKSLKDGNKTLVLGGDHSIAIGSIFAHSKFVEDQKEKGDLDLDLGPGEDNFCCLWVAAHADINTANTSYSGNLHGQCLSYLLKSDIIEHYVRLVRGFEWMGQRKSLRPERLALIGLRDIDSKESKLLHELGVTYCSMHDIDKHGIDHCFEKCIDKINPSGSRSTHVSFNIDALDPDLAPSTGTPVPGGLSLREAQFLGERLNTIGVEVNVMDLVEVNPNLWRDFPKSDGVRTAKHANYIIESFFGRDRGGTFKDGSVLPLKNEY